MVKGAELAPLLGHEIDHFEVLAMHDGKLAPIPFQVDQVLPDGSFALPNGPNAVGGDRSGLLDRDDELVMMISDLGDRAEKLNALPKDTLEIDVSDPLGGADRYAYISAVASPARSLTDYVDFNPIDYRVDSEHYRLDIRDGRPVEFAPQDYKHEQVSTIIDGFKVRIYAKLFKFFRYRLTEKDLNTHLLAWKDGPVRVLLKDSHSIDLMFGIRSPEVTSQVLFYRDSIENPFEVKLPWIPGAIFGDLQVRVYLDIVDPEAYRTVWSGQQTQPLPLPDARPERVIDDESSDPVVNWVSVISGGRAMLQTLVPNSDMSLIEKRLYYSKSASLDGDRPVLRLTSLQSQAVKLGYTMRGWRKLSSGTHYFDSMFISAPAECRPTLLFKEMEKAPTVSIRPAEGFR